MLKRPLYVQRVISSCPTCGRTYNHEEFGRLGLATDLDTEGSARRCGECGQTLVCPAWCEMTPNELWQRYEDYVSAHPTGTRRPFIFARNRLEKVVLETLSDPLQHWYWLPLLAIVAWVLLLLAAKHCG